MRGTAVCWRLPCQGPAGHSTRPPESKQCAEAREPGHTRLQRGLQHPHPRQRLLPGISHSRGHPSAKLQRGDLGLRDVLDPVGAPPACEDAQQLLLSGHHHGRAQLLWRDPYGPTQTARERPPLAGTLEARRVDAQVDASPPGAARQVGGDPAIPSSDEAKQLRRGASLATRGTGACRRSNRGLTRTHPARRSPRRRRAQASWVRGRHRR